MGSRKPKLSSSIEVPGWFRYPRGITLVKSTKGSGKTKFIAKEC